MKALKPNYSTKQILLIITSCFYLFTLFVFVENEKTLVYSKIAFLIAIIVAGVNIDIKRVRFTIIDMLMSAFALFCLASALWSPIPDKSLEMSWTMLQLVVMFIVFRLGFRDFGNEKVFAQIIAFAGIGMCIFYISFYGFTGYINAMNGSIRLGSEFENTNTIGGASAFVLLTSIYLGVNHHKSWYILSLLSAIVMLGAGSRTGIVVALIGLSLVLWNCCFTSNVRKAPRRLFIITISIIIVAYLIINASTIPFLHSTYERFKSFFDAINGKTTMMGSTKYRMEMLRVGTDLFLKHPLFGNGINGTKNALYEAGVPYTVLHNNYIELLADVGIIGFLLYYSIYALTLKAAIKQFRTNNFFTLMLLFMMLALDIGGVTYYMQRNCLFLVFASTALETDERERDNAKRIRNVFGH